VPGLQVFPTLKAALDAGFSVYDKTAEGYIVRTRTNSGYQLAEVRLKDLGATA
jgi:hypothetical protein